MDKLQINHDHLETKNFLEMLFSPYFKDRKGLIEFRLISKAGEYVFSKFYSLCDIGDSVFEELQRLNEMYHVYFGVNPRPLSKKKKKVDITDVVCFWVDVDGKNFDGDKEEALQRIEAFPSPPTSIVDSGHGYHCYWVLRTPIVDLSKEKKLEFEQILSGLVDKLGGDRKVIPVSSCMRLPGTQNIKDSIPLDCKVLIARQEKTYELQDLVQYRDLEYKEPQAANDELPSFGSKQLIVSVKDSESAISDVKRLEVDSKTKNRIITGALLTSKGSDKTRSGRDMSILYHLISNDYDYETIRGVFFNPLLGCSNRICSKGEAALQWDVRRAFDYVQRHKSEGTSQSREIFKIKTSFSGEEKRRKMNDFIKSDLLSSDNAAGYGLKNEERGEYFLFDKDEKMLMNLESDDFYLYMRIRFNISRRDFDEIKDEVKAEIWKNGREVTPHRFAYLNDQKFVQYVSDNGNHLYRLDGDEIKLCDNGTDGVFFEVDPAQAPYAYDPKLEVVNYFEDCASVEILGFTYNYVQRGLSMSLFLQERCLLNKFLIDRVNFIQDKDNQISPYEQKLLLIIDFYSSFFKTIIREKPITCFIGKKASGKSFISTSIGKILFGDKFEACHFPENTDDLKTALGRNHYLVFDNVDGYIKDDVSNVLCVAATGGTVTKRKLYTDSDEVRYTPDCFFAITSREPKFKRDDLVSRLLLFNTEKIENPISRSALFRSLLENRNAIMTEVLVNLNSIVKVLRLWKNYEPRCVSRIADWEVFGLKMCGFAARFIFRLVMEMMNEKKDKFAIDEDPLYLILVRIVYENGEELKEVPSSDLYSRFLEEGGKMKLNLHDF